MTQLETFDQCSLKDNPHLIGTVERTHSDFNTHEPLDDLLIIAHAPVGPPILTQFLVTGAPERGYVFVAWADEALGHSLVAESQLNLIDRPLTIGDTVKRHADDAMIGTVISVSEHYTLQPICWEDARGTVRFKGNIAAPDGTCDDEAFNKDPRGKCGPECTHTLKSGTSHVSPHLLLYDIPGEELKKADDFYGGDYVIHQDWLGEVREAISDVVLQLSDQSLVMVDDSGDLELLVVDSGNPLVALPEHDGFRKPDIVSYNRGLATIPPAHLNRGQFVVTSNKNIQLGRWIHGGPSNAPAQGHIIDIRTRFLDVNWLVPNIQDPTCTSKPPSNGVRVYENLSTFRQQKELRPRKDVVYYDRGRRPSTSTSKSGSSITEGQEVHVGDHVRFRDLSGAALKYQDPNGKNGHFRKIPREAFEGFDMNEFKIVCSRQASTVRWQDQTITKELSTSLLPYSAPDYEICPGEIVALKEETEQISKSDPFVGGTAYNEIKYLQGGYDLRLRKVGVVQAVDANERLASIRWFSDAFCDLISEGNVLKSGSRVGPISDEVEEVSIYEIMTHPALLRHRREIVIVPSALDGLGETVNKLWAPYASSGHTGACALSYLRPWHLPSVVEYLSGALEPISKHILPRASTTQIRNRRNDRIARSDDWVGEIVDLGLDGLVTVRLGATPECREIRVPLHMILMIVDSPAYDDVDDAGSAGSEFIDDLEDWASDESPIEETIEYEGGQRLDDDSDDSMWSTDEDNETVEAKNLDTDGDVDMDDHMANEMPKSDPERALPPATSTVNSQQLLTESVSQIISISSCLTERPPQFDVLSGSPPVDFIPNTSTPSINGSMMRRIRKEHKILLSSLPSNIYVRSFESRLDLFRCLIFGPENTPYEYAPFVIDLSLPSNFPSSPPHAYFHSWTHGLGRVNPNLYEEGKICLSLLGTWPGKSPDENWSEKASLLQILVSLMGLVLVKDPFFNEAGFDTFKGQGEYGTEARLYTEKAFVMARGFVKHALKNGVAGMEDVLAWNYLSPTIDRGLGNESTKREEMLSKVISRAHSLIQYATVSTSGASSSTSLPNRSVTTTDLTDGAGDPSSNEAFLPVLSKGAIAMLRKTIIALEKIQREAAASTTTNT